MTPTEAIKDLQTEMTQPNLISFQRRNEAINLGIQALKFRQRWEQQEGEDNFPLLPGETKE